MDQEVKKLVKQLTGFKESTENFKRTLQFVQSNFRFHRYLDVDSHKITRTLEGIQEKLIIHSHPEKAASLKRCIEVILNNPLSPASKDTKTDAHYAVLSLLLHLSNSPSNATFRERKPDTEKVTEPEFDWTSYLLQGLQPIRSFNESSEEDWSDEEENSSNDPGRRDEHRTDAQPHDALLLHSPALQTAHGDMHYGINWTHLSENVVVQYWHGELDPLLHSDHLTTQMARHWEYLDQASTPFPTPSQRVQLTEIQIIRESMWILMGAGKSFVYLMEGNQYTAREHIQVSHLTPAALHCITKQLAVLGSKVLQLQSFIDRMRDTPMSYCKVQMSWGMTRKPSATSEKEAASPSDTSEEEASGRLPLSLDLDEIPGKSQSIPDILRDTPHQSKDQDQTSTKPSLMNCQTYEAFAEALAKFLDDLRRHLVQEEKKVVAQEETYTLAIFMDWLQSWIRPLNLAHTVYQRGVVDISAEIPSHRVYFLLLVLHSTINEYYNLAFEAEAESDLLWRLWLATTRPYISFINKWLMYGILSDAAHEFAIQRNPDILIKSDTFWKKAFSLQALPIHETDGTFQPDSTNQRSASLSREAATPVSRTAPSSLKGVPNAVPGFLQPVLSHVLLAGKSMELLEATGKLSKSKETGSGDVFDVFHQNLATSSPPTLNAPITKPTPMVERAASSSSQTAVAEVVQRQLSQRGYSDPLIAHGINDVGPAENFNTENVTPKHNNDLIPSGLSQPLELVMYRQLYPVIIQRCQSVCSQLASVLKTDFQLQEHLLSLRRFYLLEAGDVMYDFYSELFNKLRRHESWQDSLNLNYLLQETLGSRYPEEAARITISVEPHRLTAKMAAQPIHSLDALTLHYKVPWPVDIIINAHALSIYNQVFRFLLQVKRALYCLQQLRYKDLTQSARSGNLADSDDDGMMSALQRNQAADTLREKLPLVHRLHILRFRLMHFVNAIHNYLMTRILYSTGLEFTAALEDAHDLDLILSIHNVYLSNVSERCLLHHRVSFVREAVSKVLNLAVIFQRRWEAGVHTFNPNNIAKAEEEFHNCCEFLSTLLASIIRRGTFPHLEALALSLSSTKSGGKQASSHQGATRNR